MSLDTESPFTLPFPPEPGERVSPGAVGPYHFEKISMTVLFQDDYYLRVNPRGRGVALNSKSVTSPPNGIAVKNNRPAGARQGARLRGGGCQAAAYGRSAALSK